MLLIRCAKVSAAPAHASATRRRLEAGLPVGERANLSKIVAMETVDRIASRSIEGT